MGTSSNGQVLLMVVVALMVSTTAFASNFHHDFEPTFGDYRVRTYGHDGQFLSLSLDKTSGSGFRSKKEYLFGRFDMTMKFVAGDSAGTVTTFYLSSEGATHDEIDFEFLGNVSGQPYTIHTNVFSQGQGGREQQFHLWFDPTKNFHTYSIVWNPKRIIFLIDEMPIRVFENNEHHGIPFPKNQPMKVYSSLWNADSWATQGGLVKTDWSKAPFTAYYRNPIIDACDKSAGPACAFSPAARTFSYSASSTNGRHRRGWRNHELDSGDKKRLRWAQQRHMIYDYCKDHKRFPHGVPPECKHYRI